MHGLIYCLYLMMIAFIAIAKFAFVEPISVARRLQKRFVEVTGGDACVCANPT